MLLHDQPKHLGLAHRGGDGCRCGTIFAGECPVLIKLPGDILNGQNCPLSGLALKLRDTSRDVHIC